MKQPRAFKELLNQKEGGVGWKDRWDRAGRALKARLRTSHRQLGAPAGSVGRIDMNPSEVYKKKNSDEEGVGLWVLRAKLKAET